MRGAVRQSLPDDRPGLKHLSSRAATRRSTPACATARCSMSATGFGMRAGCETDTVMLVRPDDHVAAIAPMREGLAEDLYRRIVGK